MSGLICAKTPGPYRLPDAVRLFLFNFNVKRMGTKNADWRSAAYRTDDKFDAANLSVFSATTKLFCKKLTYLLIFFVILRPKYSKNYTDMDAKQPKRRIATQRAIEQFEQKFGLNENDISKLLGEKYLQKLSKCYKSINDFIIFRFKTLSDTETTSNQDMANYIMAYLDKKINESVFVCRNYEEYKGFTEFLSLLPAIKNDVLENGETLLSKYSPISEYAFNLLEKRYHETEEFWKRDEITAAMILSPAIREFGKIKKQIHCYTQKDGDILITLDKYDWDGKEYTKSRHTPEIKVKNITVEIVDSKDNSGSGCLVAVIFFILTGASLFII